MDEYKTTDKNNRFDEYGREVLNPTPMQPPLGYTKAPSLAQQIREQILSMRALEDNDPETEEEADDFEIEDDPAPVSRWENDLVPSIKETRARARALEQELKLYAKPEAPPPDQEEPPADQAPEAD